MEMIGAVRSLRKDTSVTVALPAASRARTATRWAPSCCATRETSEANFFPAPSATIGSGAKAAPSMAYSTAATPPASEAVPSRRRSARCHAPENGAASVRTGGVVSVENTTGSLVSSVPSAAVTLTRVGGVVPSPAALTRNTGPSVAMARSVDGGSSSAFWMAPPVT